MHGRPLTAAPVAIGKERNVVDLHHLPEGTHSLAPRPGSLVRLTFQKWSARQDSHLQPFRFERNVSADWTTRGWCPRPDLHRHCARFKGAVSALDYVGKLVAREGFAPSTFPF